MLLRFSDVLNADDVGFLRAARDCVHDSEHASAMIASRLRSHPLFMLAVQPRHLSKATLGEHRPGEVCEVATPPAVFGDCSEYRADVGVVLFLSNPDDYCGGDLVLRGCGGEERVRGALGECVVCPGSTPHGWLSPVSGTLRTAHLWAQSLIRDPLRREILYDLGYAHHLVQLFGPDRTEDLGRLESCRRNLFRAWAEP